MTRLSEDINRIEAALKTTSAASSDFDLNPDTVLPEGRKLRDAAVLIALQEGPTGTDVILTKRSSALKHHPGQIAFPGGGRDDTDASLWDTALRETEEEIGLPREAVTRIGEMACHETVTGFRVTPFIGAAPEFVPIPEQGEVAEVFTAPLAHLMEPANYQIQSRRWRGAQRFYYVVPYGPYYIWGATARILRSLAEQVSG
jgi:8-oxo-dGTP pyrophosphatase MutT (NUDIX family)